MDDAKNVNRSLFNPWMILGVAGLVLIVVAAGSVGIWLLRPEPATKGAPTAILFVIAAPTLTQPVPTSPAILTPTPEDQPLPAPPPGVISPGALVQITGTGTDGLRLRAAPGLSNDILLLGLEAEVFNVIDGPREADGYTWWHLEAPYDSSVRGWAVANYLAVIQNP